jgi:hypothetical protein
VHGGAELEILILKLNLITVKIRYLKIIKNWTNLCQDIECFGYRIPFIEWHYSDVRLLNGHLSWTVLYMKKKSYIQSGADIRTNPVIELSFRL